MLGFLLKLITAKSGPWERWGGTLGRGRLSWSEDEHVGAGSAMQSDTDTLPVCNQHTGCLLKQPELMLIHPRFPSTPISWWRELFHSGLLPLCWQQVPFSVASMTSFGSFCVFFWDGNLCSCDVWGAQGWKTLRRLVCHASKIVFLSLEYLDACQSSHYRL